MNIEKVDIRYLSTGRGSLNREGVVHRKSLPFHSIVQAVEGSYEIGLCNETPRFSPEGGFFIAPPFAEQQIIHHLSKDGLMQMRWIFFDVQINERPMEELFSLPLLPSSKMQKSLFPLADRIFAQTEICLRMACMYEILDLLLKNAVFCDKKNENALANAVKTYLERNYADPTLDTKRLCEQFFISRATLFRLFNEKLGTPPGAYLHKIRLERAAFLLVTTERSVTQISEEIGFGDFPYFSKLFKKHFGRSPGEYRKNAVHYMPGSA